MLIFKVSSMLLISVMINHAKALCDFASDSCGAGCWNERDIVLTTGLRVCVAVGLGWYSPINDNQRYRCRSGQFSGDTDMSSSCSICPAGSLSGVGRSMCSPCTPGYYQDLPGQSICKNCDTSHYDGPGSNAFTYDPSTDTVFCELTGIAPSAMPSSSPTTIPTDNPSSRPSFAPSLFPTVRSSTAPTSYTSEAPSLKPSQAPLEVSSLAPSQSPSVSPSLVSSSKPSLRSSFKPSTAPTRNPSMHPSMSPSLSPSLTPHWANNVPTSAKVVSGTIFFILSVLLIVALLMKFGCCCSARFTVVEEAAHGGTQVFEQKHETSAIESYVVADAVIVEENPPEHSKQKRQTGTSTQYSGGSVQKNGAFRLV